MATRKVPTKAEMRKKITESLTPEQLKEIEKGAKKLPPICGGIKPPAVKGRQPK